MTLQRYSVTCISVTTEPSYRSGNLSTKLPECQRLLVTPFIFLEPTAQKVYWFFIYNLLCLISKHMWGLFLLELSIKWLNYTYELITEFLKNKICESIGKIKRCCLNAWIVHLTHVFADQLRWSCWTGHNLTLNVRVVYWEVSGIKLTGAVE